MLLNAKLWHDLLYEQCSLLHKCIALYMQALVKAWSCYMAIYMYVYVLSIINVSCWLTSVPTIQYSVTSV